MAPVRLGEGRPFPAEQNRLVGIGQAVQVVRHLARVQLGQDGLVERLVISAGHLQHRRGRVEGSVHPKAGWRAARCPKGDADPAWAGIGEEGSGLHGLLFFEPLFRS